MVGERNRRGERKGRLEKKRKEMEREKERKIQSGSETDRDRDGALERMESKSEKNAKMHAAARWRADGGFDEDRPSRERVVISFGGKRSFERGTMTREERRTCRYERKWRRGGGTGARGDRERERESTAQGGRGRARGNGDEKERRYARKERRNDIERERKREG